MSWRDVRHGAWNLFGLIMVGASFTSPIALLFLVSGFMMGYKTKKDWEEHRRRQRQ